MQQFGPRIFEGIQAILQRDRDGASQRQGELLAGLRGARRD